MKPSRTYLVEGEPSQFRFTYIDDHPVIKLAAAAQARYEIFNPDGSRYVTRYLIAGHPGLGVEGLKDPPYNVYLHWLHTPDCDRHLHDHPWAWGHSTVLHGGYEEDRIIGGGGMLLCAYRPGSHNLLYPGIFHRIAHVEPATFTLFTTGPHDQDWGFLAGGVKVGHREYLTQQKVTHGQANTHAGPHVVDLEEIAAALQAK